MISDLASAAMVDTRTTAKAFDSLCMTAPPGYQCYTRVGPANHHSGYFDAILSVPGHSAEILLEEIKGTSSLCTFCGKSRLKSCPGHRIGMLLPFYHIPPYFTTHFIKFLNSICLNIKYLPGQSLQFNGCCCPRSAAVKKGTVAERLSAISSKCKTCGAERIGKYYESRFVAPKNIEADGGVRYLRGGEEMYVPLEPLMTYMYSDDRAKNIAAACAQYRINIDIRSMVTNVIYILPVQLRQTMGGRQQFETEMLLSIYNECCTARHDIPSTSEAFRPYAANIYRFIDRLRTKKAKTVDTETALHRLNGKYGYIRQFVIGAHAWNEGRAVVVPSPGNLGEFGAPRYFQSLSTIEVANVYNIGRLRKMAQNRLIAYIRRYKSMEVIRFGATSSISIGDEIYRNAITGDPVIANRQPTLHRLAIMGHHLQYTTEAVVKLHRSETTPYNADFDGDEMNMHMPMTINARIELLGHAHVINNIRESGLPAMSVVFHELAIMMILSIKAPEIAHDTEKYLKAFTKSVDFERRKKSYPARRAYMIEKGLVNVREYERALDAMDSNGAPSHGGAPSRNGGRSTTVSFTLDISSMPLIVTYRDVLSLLFPEDFTFSKTGVKIMDGVFIEGEFKTSNIGLSPGSIVHSLNPSKRAALLITDVCNICDVFMTCNGISFNINDMIYNKEYYMEIFKIVAKTNPLLEEALQKKASAISQFEKNQIERSISLFTNASTKHIMDSIEQVKRNSDSKLKNISENATVEEREAIMQEIRDKRTSNIFEIMYTSGCRGSTKSAMQMSMVVGAQYVGAERSNASALPWIHNAKAFPGSDGKPKQTVLANGIVESSFLRGLLPEEYFVHSEAARESITTGKLGISDSGYCAKLMSGVYGFYRTCPDMTVSFGNTVVSESMGAFIDPTQQYVTSYNGHKATSFVDMSILYHSMMYKWRNDLQPDI